MFGFKEHVTNMSVNFAMAFFSDSVSFTSSLNFLNASDKVPHGVSSVWNVGDFSISFMFNHNVP